MFRQVKKVDAGEPVKRGRGRPPKGAPKVPKAKPAKASGGSGGRGRPPKAKPESPPKKAASEEDEDEEEEEEEE